MSKISREAELQKPSKPTKEQMALDRIGQVINCVSLGAYEVLVCTHVCLGVCIQGVYVLSHTRYLCIRIYIRMILCEEFTRFAYIACVEHVYTYACIYACINA